MLTSKFIGKAGVFTALLCLSSLGLAATDEELAALKQRIADLESTSAWSQATGPAEVNPLSIHGFVNAGISSANNDAAAPVSGGISDNLNYQAHQSFGLQVAYTLDDKTDVVAQMLGRAYQDNMNVRMNWAYVGRTLFQDKGPMSDLKLRVGRAPADIYMISEYYDVGYAYPWVIPPREAYDLLGGVPYDGIDLAANFNLPADWNMQLKGFVGEVNVEPEFGKERFDLRKIVGVNAVFERDAWRVRLGYGQADVGYDVCCGDVSGFDQLSGGYNSLEAGYEELVAGVQAIDPSYTPAYTATPITDTGDNLSGSFSGVGFSYDNGNWLVMGEYMFQKWDTYNPDMDLAYLTIGKRFGEWMPYATVSQAKVADDDDATALSEQIATLKANLGSAQVDNAITGATASAEGGKAAAEAGITFYEGEAATAVGASDGPGYATAQAGIEASKDGLAQAEAALADLAALQAGLAEFNVSADMVAGGLNGLSLPQKTYSVGLRYDFAPGATAKLQVDKITDFEDTRGDLENAYVSHFTIQAAF